MIETVVAIFVLTTGLISGLALAISSFSASSEISDKIAATGLAREGIEAMRRMRDTNWLASKAAGGLIACTDLDPPQPCYPTWLDESYDIWDQAGGGTVYRIDVDLTSAGNKWSAVLSNSSDDFRLYLQSGGGLGHTLTSSPTKFFRKVEIEYVSTVYPYTPTSPLVLVRSTVWWVGGRCPVPSGNYLADPSQTTCRLITEEYLTNWRNY